MTKKYFGTDGIRGKVGKHPITAEFMLKLGWATGRVLGRAGGDMVIIGKDTRISGYMFESAMEAGLPYADNGIKFFSRQGTKLPDEIELAIETELDKPMETVDSARLGKAERVPDARGRYIEFCKSTVPMSLSLQGLKLVVDCANGATYQVAPSVFDELGAEVIEIGTTPDGLNINQECGSTRPEWLQKVVQEQGADAGIALDGDGDRVIMVDSRGELVDGDELLFIIARSRRLQGRLGGSVVGTLMSNLGLEHALQTLGISLERARVGDRYVLELLQQNGGTLGGESSGHIICLDRTTTGDGIVAALQVLTTMCQDNKSLHELKAGMKKYPQHMINVPVSRRLDLAAEPCVQEAVKAVEQRLNGRGRVLLRPSGTEPVVRVMVEGEDEMTVVEQAGQLAEVVSAAATG
jgi:phosphoglucosamine mutase